MVQYCAQCGRKNESDGSKKKCDKCGKFMAIWQPVPVETSFPPSDVGPPAAPSK